MWYPPSIIAGKNKDYNIRVGFLGLLLISFLNEIGPFNPDSKEIYASNQIEISHLSPILNPFIPIEVQDGAIKADVSLDLVELFKARLQRVPLDPRIRLPNDIGIVEVAERTSPKTFKVLTRDGVLNNKSQEEGANLWVPKKDLSAVLRAMLTNPEQVEIRKLPLSTPSKLP